MRPLLAVLALLASCGGDRGEDSRLTVWFHTGKPSERQALERQVEAYNALGRETIELVLLPEEGYHTQVEAQAAAGKLPDVLDFDGPFLANYVWKGYLVPLEDHLPSSLQDDLLSSIRVQGEYLEHLYGVGAFDSGLCLYADRRALTRARVRVPRGVEDAWTTAEFAPILAALRRHDDDGRVLDLKLNYRGEWSTYAFSPCLWSAGGGLVSRTPPVRATGVLDGEASISALRTVRSWFADDSVDPNTDDRAFVDRRVALSWSGHWDYPRYREALGEDLAVLPLPDFGRGSCTGQGSWVWGITRDCEDHTAAARFVAFLLETERILETTEANGAIPATHSAVAASTLYAPDGPLHLLAQQLETSALPRPITPAYPVITDAFQRAFAAVRDGGDIEDALGGAARAIDREVSDNDGYR